MQTRPEISIIMPVKDTGPFLDECLESILNQSFTNWELIAVENGSSDNSWEVLRKHAINDGRVRLFQLPESDLLGALRKGASEAIGKYIHRMDSDDRMPLNKMALMHQAIKRTNPGTMVTGMVEYFSSVELGDGFKKYEKWLSNVVRTNAFKEDVYKECTIPSSCWMLHRKDFDAIGGFNPNVFPEDYDLCFRMIKGDLSIIGIPEVLHYWRDHTQRISRNWDEYSDYRFFKLKVPYFLELNYDQSRPLTVWGAGKNGKDLIKELKNYHKGIHWICDNERKIGKHIYDLEIEGLSILDELKNPQIIVAVASPTEQQHISDYLNNIDMLLGKDYWFFS